LPGMGAGSDRLLERTKEQS